MHVSVHNVPIMMLVAPYSAAGPTDLSSSCSSQHQVASLHISVEKFSCNSTALSEGRPPYWKHPNSVSNLNHGSFMLTSAIIVDVEAFMDTWRGLSGKVNAPEECGARRVAVFTLQFHLKLVTPFCFPLRAARDWQFRPMLLVFALLFFPFKNLFFSRPPLFVLNYEYRMPKHGVGDNMGFIGVAVTRKVPNHVCQLWIIKSTYLLHLTHGYLHKKKKNTPLHRLLFIFGIWYFF